MDVVEFENLIDVLKEKALAGDVQSLRHLGDALYQGASGTEKNTKLAFPYWKRAVDKGDISLAHKIGFALFSGDAGYKNETEALHYFLLAADNGNVDAAHAAGLCYMHGFGCDVDTNKAKVYFEFAALRNHGEAQWNLGSLQFLDKEHDWMHWICCAHLSGVGKATDFLNHMIDNGGSGEAFQYQIELIQKNGIDPRNTPTTTESSSEGGCYVATAVYGSYDCPQVWTLRRYRDYILAETWYGRAFIRAYYAISPTFVKWFGHTQWFKKLWKDILDKKIKTLQTNGVESTPYQDKPW